MRPTRLVERKRVLASLLTEAAANAPRILYSEHFENGTALFAHAGALGLEGIVSKRADAPLHSSTVVSWRWRNGFQLVWISRE
jgi:bifunctional non-homologous end joining protein LigD